MFGYCILSNDQNIITALLDKMSGFPEYNCVGIERDYNAGGNFILKEKPEVTFLDLDMGIDHKNCFEFVSEFLFYEEVLPNFIGLSNSKNLAYQCIKSKFFDYLLKPLDEYELRKSIMSFHKDYSGSIKRRLCLKSNSDYHYINLKDIIYLQADNNSTDIFLNNGSKISAFDTLKKFEQNLPSFFLRTHNSYIVNSTLINRVNFGKNKISLLGCEHLINIPLSKKYRQEMLTFNRKVLENKLSMFLN